MSGPYRDAGEHLEDELALIALLVQRQIVAHWELGILPRIKDDFSGTFVSGNEVKALLAGGHPITPDGERALGDLDGALRVRAEAIEARLAASRDAGEVMPFDRLRQAFALTPTEQRVLWTLIGLEVNPRLRPLMRYLVNEASRVHADVGLLELLVYGGAASRGLLVRELAADAPLFRYRLLEHVGSARQVEDAPLLLSPLRVNRRVVELVSGWTRLDVEVARVATLIERPASFAGLLLPDELKAQVVALVRGADTADAPAPAMVLAGHDGSGRRSLICGAAAALGHAVLRVDCHALPNEPGELARLGAALVREAILFGAVPMLVDIDELAPNPEGGRGDRAAQLDRILEDFGGPVTGTCRPRDSRPIALARGLVLIDVPTPSEAVRATLWQRALGDAGEGLDVVRAAARYRVTGGIIGRAATSAEAVARSRGDGRVTDKDLHVGLRSTLDAKLSGLGLRIQWRQRWDDLVLPEDAMLEVREFIGRVKHSRRVYEDWGFARKLAKGLGLSALFSGPPGTGKTMVAGLIADELSLDLYQIDLSRIVSKYVGETEKNLANLFDAAEAGHAILLFDEADSLFAKRTDVKSSVDRYANLEVNYLLQRIESFTGITILTTNLDSSIDEAFRRRLSFRIHFPFPEPEERETLWRTMIPTEADVGTDLDFKLLAQRYEMSGGHIRNAVLRAAFLAADDESPISMRHLGSAAALEYAAMGKVMTNQAHR